MGTIKFSRLKIIMMNLKCDGTPDAGGNMVNIIDLSISSNIRADFVMDD